MQVSPHEFGNALTYNWQEMHDIPEDEEKFKIAFFNDQFIISEDQGQTIYLMSLTPKSFKKGMMQVEKYFNIKINQHQQLSQLREVREFIAFKNYVIMECDDPFGLNMKAKRQELQTIQEAPIEEPILSPDQRSLSPELSANKEQKQKPPRMMSSEK